jgi:hypothetical protein
MSDDPNYNEAAVLRESIQGRFEALKAAVKAGLVLTLTNKEGHMATGGGMFVETLPDIVSREGMALMGYRFVDTADGDTIMEPSNRAARGALKLLQTEVPTPATCSAAEEIRKKGNIVGAGGWDMLRGAELPVTDVTPEPAPELGQRDHTLRMDEDDLRELLHELRHLRAQRTELQKHNTAYHDQVVELKNRIRELESRVGVDTETGA